MHSGFWMFGNLLQPEIEAFIKYSKEWVGCFMVWSLWVRIKCFLLFLSFEKVNASVQKRVSSFLLSQCNHFWNNASLNMMYYYVILYSENNMSNVWPILLKERFSFWCIHKVHQTRILQRFEVFLPPCYFSMWQLTLGCTPRQTLGENHIYLLWLFCLRFPFFPSVWLSN